MLFKKLNKKVKVKKRLKKVMNQKIKIKKLKEMKKMKKMKGKKRFLIENIKSNINQLICLMKTFTNM